jgi:hypothetical protein
MTTATMALTELAEKGADVDVLRQMVQFMAQRLMELDVEVKLDLPPFDGRLRAEVFSPLTFPRKPDSFELEVGRFLGLP